MDTKYIFAKPEHIEGIGHVYPVLMDNYDEFSDYSRVLGISRGHFKEEYANYYLLDLIVNGTNDENVVPLLTKLLTLVLRKEAYFITQNNVSAFILDEEHAVTNENFEELRMVIMKQNLIFEPKIYKNKMVQEWAEKVIASKSKGGVKITIEDMITTVSIVAGKSYEQIALQTIYQLNADFKRVQKDKDYHVGISAKIAGSDMDVGYFAEEINLFSNPYDGLFVDSGNLNTMNQSLG